MNSYPTDTAWDWNIYLYLPDVMTPGQPPQLIHQKHGAAAKSSSPTVPIPIRLSCFGHDPPRHPEGPERSRGSYSVPKTLAGPGARSVASCCRSTTPSPLRGPSSTRRARPRASSSAAAASGWARARAPARAARSRREGQGEGGGAKGRFGGFLGVRESPEVGWGGFLGSPGEWM